jgi:hypothetical protein
MEFNGYSTPNPTAWNAKVVNQLFSAIITALHYAEHSKPDSVSQVLRSLSNPDQIQ